MAWWWSREIDHLYGPLCGRPTGIEQRVQQHQDAEAQAQQRERGSHFVFLVGGAKRSKQGPAEPTANQQAIAVRAGTMTMRRIPRLASRPASRTRLSTRAFPGAGQAWPQLYKTFWKCEECGWSTGHMPKWSNLKADHIRKFHPDLRDELGPVPLVLNWVPWSPDCCWKCPVPEWFGAQSRRRRMLSIVRACNTGVKPPR